MLDEFSEVERVGHAVVGWCTAGAFVYVVIAALWGFL